MASPFFFIEATAVNLAFRYLKCLKRKYRSQVILHIKAESEIGYNYSYVGEEKQGVSGCCIISGKRSFSPRDANVSIPY